MRLFEKQICLIPLIYIMTDNTHQPSPYDAVLGRQSSSSVNPDDLDRLEAVKKRLNNGSEQVRIAALKEALNYGQPGLALVFQIVKNGTGAIQKSGFDLLLERLVREREKIDREILELTTKYFPLGSDFEVNATETTESQKNIEESLESIEKIASVQLSFQDIFVRIQKVFSEQQEVNPEEVTLETPVILGSYGCYRASGSSSWYSSSGYHSSSYIFSTPSQNNPLNIDELDSVELIMAVEEEFDIEIPDEAVENIKTIKELVNYIEAKLY